MSGGSIPQMTHNECRLLISEIMGMRLYIGWGWFTFYEVKRKDKWASEFVLHWNTWIRAEVTMALPAYVDFICSILLFNIVETATFNILGTILAYHSPERACL